MPWLNRTRNPTQVVPLLLHQAKTLKDSHEALKEVNEAQATRIAALEKKMETLLMH